ncbi:MAG: dienelactone hydrolase family protein [Bacteroidota bacterium]|nr:dienelactone hydrolase family protein [Bacteroidota bacterium]
MQRTILLLLLIVIFSNCSNSPKQSQLGKNNLEKPLHSVTDPKGEWIDGQPVVFLLHGWNSNPANLVAIKRRLSKHYNYVAIQAPYKLGENLYSWFDIKFKKKGIVIPKTSEFNSSRMKLHNFIEIYKKEKDISSEDVVVLGFSQGATMALELAVSYPESISAAMIVAGMFAQKRSINDIPGDEICNIDFFHAHGTSDEIVPLKEARKIRRYLRNCPNYSFKKYKTGHEMTQAMLKDMKRWLNHRLR